MKAWDCIDTKVWDIEMDALFFRQMTEQELAKCRIFEKPKDPIYIVGDTEQTACGIIFWNEKLRFWAFQSLKNKETWTAPEILALSNYMDKLMKEKMEVIAS